MIDHFGSQLSISSWKVARKKNSAQEDVGTKQVASEISAMKTEDTGNLRADTKNKQAAPKTKLLYPEEVATALEDLQKFTEEIIRTKCCACKKPLMHDFKVSHWFQGWIKKHNSGNAFSICSSTCKNSKCGAKTCIGCGREPRTGRFTSTCNGLKLDWCCEDGRLFAFWVALCKYDEIELQQQMESAANLAAHSARGPPISKGTGYAGKQGWGLLAMAPQNSNGMALGGGWSGGRMARGQQMNHALNFQQADEKTDPLIGYILSLIIELLPIPLDDGPKLRAPPALRAMIQLSLLVDKVADMLRNDSLRDVSKRSEVYNPVLDFVQRLGKRGKTRYLVCDQRFLKKRSSGLQVLSASESFTNDSREDQPLVIAGSKDDLASSVVGCMAKLAAQAKQLAEQTKADQSVKNEFYGETGKSMLQMASKIDKIYSSLATPSYDNQGSKSGKDNACRWDAYHEKHRVDRDSSISNYLCSKVSQAAHSVVNSPRGRIRRIISEQVEMTTSLPQHVFVKVHDSYPHIMKCLIIGPEDTPYEGGMFEFDILCKEDYPMGPPFVQIVTTGRGTVRFNPNLYADGKVCLSLLGTWPGPPESKWQPQKSTLESILSSIQAMILNKNPMENEPGYENHSTQNKSANRDYNFQCQALTIRYAVLDWLQRPEMRNGPWKDVVANYFRLRGDKILATAQKWAKQNRLIEAFKAEIVTGQMSAPVLFFGSRLPFSNKTNLLKELEAALGQTRLG